MVREMRQWVYLSLGRKVTGAELERMVKLLNLAVRTDPDCRFSPAG